MHTHTDITVEGSMSASWRHEHLPDYNVAGNKIRELHDKLGVRRMNERTDRIDEWVIGNGMSDGTWRAQSNGDGIDWPQTAWQSQAVIKETHSQAITEQNCPTTEQVMWHPRTAKITGIKPDANNDTIEPGMNLTPLHSPPESSEGKNAKHTGEINELAIKWNAFERVAIQHKTTMGNYKKSRQEDPAHTSPTHRKFQ